MSEAVVAYRYAKALIDLAIEQKSVEAVNQDMALFASVCEQNKEFTAVMANPIVRHEDKKNILNKVFSGKVSEITMAIFKILTSKNRENLLRPIALEFQKLYQDLNKIQKASVTSVVALTDKQKAEFSKMVEDASGKKVILEEKVDGSLIGGFILKVGDTQIDTSIKKRLNDLKLELA